MKTVFINHINLRSGVIFFLLLCFFGSRGKKIAPSSRKQITEIKGEGMIACYNHISKVNPHIRQHFLANGGCLVPMRPKIHVAAPFPRQKKNVGVMVRIHVGYRERTGREVTSVHILSSRYSVRYFRGTDQRNRNESIVIQWNHDGFEKSSKRLRKSNCSSNPR